MARRALGFALWAVASAACGRTAAPSLPSGPPASLVATAEGTGDVIVARVDGKPVWGSCVAAQARREHVAREVALHECVDFELLAQAADRRGLARDPEVVDATRTALVNQLVAHAYEDAYTRPDDFGEFWNRAMIQSKLVYRFRHVEYRASTYVRVPVKAKPPADDPAAHALADKIAAAVANEHGLTGPDFVAIAERVAGSAPIEHADMPLYKRGGLVDSYADALWAIPEVGSVSPAVRTPWGWDVILWTDDQPAANPSDDELARDALPAVQQVYFGAWAAKVGHALGVHVTVDPQADHRLESVQ